MGRAQRNVEEERLLFALARLNVLDRLAGQAGQHVDRRVVGDDLVVLDHRLHVAGMMKAAEMVEAAMKRTVRNLRPHRRALELFSGILFPALGIQILEVEVPFADDRRVVALLLQETRHGRAVLGDKTGSKALDHALLEAGTPTVSPRQQTIPRGSADG